MNALEIRGLCKIFKEFKLEGIDLTLPFIFRFGVAKGRTIYYFVIGALAAVCIGVSKTYNVAFLEGEITAFSLVVICVISAAVFALSWVLSVALYKKRRSV